MNIRTAVAKDFEGLYTLGLATPEFRVSADGEFMEPDEFLSAIENTHGTFLLAEDNGSIAGFIYASRKDVERASRTKWACLVYLVVKPECRHMGIAQNLYNECIKRLKQFGITSVYAWGNVESDGAILKFMNKQGFYEGHKYVWMDKKI